MKSDQKATGAEKVRRTEQGDGESSGARSALAIELAALASLDLEALRLRWRNETGRSAAAHLPKRLLLRMLAYRIQSAIHGDLDADAKRLLDRLRDGADLASAARPGALGRAGSLKPGTVLVREWKETLHRVIVRADGFEWQGQRFASLSAVAEAITGTCWSGPRFFGLKTSAQRRAASIERSGMAIGIGQEARA